MSKGAMASVFALALAFPVAGATAASAAPTNPLVVLRGSVNCSSFGPAFVPTALSVETARASNSTVINAATPRGTYSQLSLNPVSPDAGDSASATLTCTSTEDGLEETKVVNFQLTRPPGATVTRTLNVL
ncbi:hypothetical protein [Streptomyces sp. NPDC014676]|uniref:hypothetical protein n=1 Tax=Streptomyces sp. NPDC014676 TaxID=3364879 RepID=UPI0036F7A7CA